MSEFVRTYHSVIDWGLDEAEEAGTEDQSIDWGVGLTEQQHLIDWGVGLTEQQHLIDWGVGLTEQQHLIDWRGEGRDYWLPGLQ